MQPITATKRLKHTFQQKRYYRIIKEHQLRKKPSTAQKDANVDQLIKVENHPFTNPNGITKSENYQLELKLLGEGLKGN